MFNNNLIEDLLRKNTIKGYGGIKLQPHEKMQYQEPTSKIQKNIEKFLTHGRGFLSIKDSLDYVIINKENLNQIYQMFLILE